MPLCPRSPGGGSPSARRGRGWPGQIGPPPAAPSSGECCLAVVSFSPWDFLLTIRVESLRILSPHGPRPGEQAPLGRPRGEFRTFSPTGVVADRGRSLHLARGSDLRYLVWFRVGFSSMRGVGRWTCFQEG